MKKILACFLLLIAILCILSCIWLAIEIIHDIVGYQFSQPDFNDFQEYEDDFVAVKDFLVERNITCNNAATLIVHLNSQFLTIAGKEISDRTIEESVRAIYEKGFTYIAIEEDCMIFWEDETGYYGVLWSANPEDAINQYKTYCPSMKARKLSKGWYEVGALDSI